MYVHDYSALQKCVYCQCIVQICSSKTMYNILVCTLELVYICNFTVISCDHALGSSFVSWMTCNVTHVTWQSEHLHSFQKLCMHQVVCLLFYLCILCLHVLSLFVFVIVDTLIDSFIHSSIHPQAGVSSKRKDFRPFSTQNKCKVEVCLRNLPSKHVQRTGFAMNVPFKGVFFSRHPLLRGLEWWRFLSTFFPIIFRNLANPKRFW